MTRQATLCLDPGLCAGFARLDPTGLCYRGLGQGYTQLEGEFIHLLTITAILSSGEQYTGTWLCDADGDVTVLLS